MDARTLLKSKGATIYSVHADQKIGDLVSLLSEHKIGVAVVQSRGGDVLGMISERDIIRGLSEHGCDTINWVVGDLMTSKTISYSPGDDMKDIMSLMEKHHFRHVPVVENGKLQGMISMRDVNKALLQEAALEREILKDYATVASTVVNLR